MKEIIINSQAEFDALPFKFEDATRIIINVSFDISNNRLIKSSGQEIK